jgi:GT2 family glycosyltransferase
VPVISVVIVNYNGKHFLEACLRSLEKQTLKGIEVILVDNGSSDGSLKYVQDNFPTVRVIALAENLGFCGGNNAGIREAKGEYVALLNNDAETDPYWLEELKKALDHHSEVGFCASRIYLRDQPGIIDSVGGTFYSCGVDGQRGHLEKDVGQYAEMEYVFGAVGAAAMYRRAVLEDIGLFDEFFFAYGEEVDLNFRAQLRAYRCLYVPTAIVYHVGGGTMKHDSDHRRYLAHRNRFFLVVKNMPRDLLVKYFFPIVCYSVLRDVSWILQGRWKVVQRAWFDSIRDLNTMLEKRREIQQRRRVSSVYIDSLLIKKWWSAL